MGNVESTDSSDKEKNIDQQNIDAFLLRASSDWIYHNSGINIVYYTILYYTKLRNAQMYFLYYFIISARNG